jgi:hypothetical protein
VRAEKLCCSKLREKNTTDNRMYLTVLSSWSSGSTPPCAVEEVLFYDSTSLGIREKSTDKHLPDLQNVFDCLIVLELWKHPFREHRSVAGDAWGGGAEARQHLEVPCDSRAAVRSTG